MFPKISIVIPCYNQGAFLSTAIKSVEGHPNKSIYEIIIVNDGSTDANTILKLNELKEKGYFVINQENKGLANARNNGIKAAKGIYILPLDSDNYIHPDYLTESIKILDDNPEIGVVYANPKYFGMVETIRKWPNFNFNNYSILFNNYIDACAVYRKSLWEKVNGYDENMPYMGVEDWDFWIRCSDTAFKFHHINKKLFYYRVEQNSMISNINKIRKEELELYVLTKNYSIIAKRLNEIKFNLFLLYVLPNNVRKAIIKILAFINIDINRLF